MELLNENLKIELIVHLNGKMLHESALFRFFNLSFLSELTFALRKETFTIDETVFEEDVIGDRLHYITKGNVILIHKKSATFISEVSIDTFIGEVSFFTGRPRKASAKSKNFTEVLTLDLSEFLDVAGRHQRMLEMFSAIRKQLEVKEGKPEDLTLLGIECYICHLKGHLSLECPQYGVIKGNLQ
jgi:CRP-like cAMP-binding protein